MRIAFDATAIPANRAGAGIYIFNLVQALAKIDTVNQYHVYAKPDHIAEFGIVQPNFHFVSMPHTSTLRRLAWEQTVLPREIKRHHIDVLHSPHYTMPFQPGCKSIVTFCDMIFVLFPHMHNHVRRIFFQRMMRRSAERADMLIAISESTRGDVLRYKHLPPERVISIPLAASDAFRRMPASESQVACARYNLTPGRFILYVGVLEPRKNVPLLMEAYARIAAEYPDVPLVIAGKKGWMYEEIFRQVTLLGITERVRFLGYVPEDDLIGLYNAARVFVYPSRYEGFGLPVLEAMQCGVPVITCNVSSLPEVAGDAALLVEPDDVVGLADSLGRVMDNDSLAHNLSARGIERARQFSWQRCAHETLLVYQSVNNST